MCSPVFASNGGKKVLSASHPSLPGSKLAIINPQAWIMDVNESLTPRMRLKKSTWPIRWREDVSLGTKMGFCQPLCLSHSPVWAHNFSHSHTHTHTDDVLSPALVKGSSTSRGRAEITQLTVQNTDFFANTYPLKYALISLHHRIFGFAGDITDWTTERE